MTTPGRETVGTKRQQGTAGGKKNFIFLKRKKEGPQVFLLWKKRKKFGQKKIEERNQQEVSKRRQSEAVAVRGVVVTAVGS